MVTGEIYVMNAGGSNQTRVTNNQHPDGHPAFSPDGKRLAFVSRPRIVGEELSSWNIYTMNADGSEVTRVTRDLAFDSEPDWQPLTVPPEPQSKADCKDGGYKEFGFKNQGQCVASLQKAAE